MCCGHVTLLPVPGKTRKTEPLEDAGVSRKQVRSEKDMARMLKKLRLQQPRARRSNP